MLPVHRFTCYLQKYQSAILVLDWFFATEANSLTDTCVKSLGRVKELLKLSQKNIDKNLENAASLNHELILSSNDGSSSTSHKARKAQPLICNISKKDILSDVLRLHNLHTAKYTTTATQKCFFVGTCKVCIGEWCGPNSSGSTRVEGEPKSSPADAEASAACNALSLLERLMGIEIVDFNYEKMMVQKQKIARVVHLRSKCDELVSDVNSSCEGLIDSLGSIIKDQHELSETVAMSGFVKSVSFAYKLEETLRRIKGIQHKAMTDIACTI